MRLMRRGSPREAWNSASTAGGSNRGSSEPARRQAVGEVAVDLVAGEAADVVADDEALAERLVDGHGQSAAQLGETDQQHAEAAFGTVQRGM